MKRTFIAVLVLVLMGWAGPVQAQQAAEGQPYVVQLNDSLWQLAQKYLGDGDLYPLIIEGTAAKAAADSSFTPISRGEVIYPGQKIWIPEAVAPMSIPTPAPTGAVSTGEPGGQIAFSFWNNHPNRCTYEINIIQVADCLAGAEQCQATRRIVPLNNISEPALAPDGTRLAFRGWGEPQNEDSPFIDCADPHPHRYIGHTTLDGTGFIGTGGYWEDAHPDWSPDGQRILFDSGRNGDGITRILMIGADGQNEEELHIPGQQPSWANDNARFVYRGCDITGNRCGLWLAQASPIRSWEAGQNLIGPLVEDPQAAHPDWSPTRDEIIYQSEGDLYLIQADGADNRRLTDSPQVEGLPVFSPDGEWIAYVTHDGQSWNLRLINRAGMDDRHLFSYNGGLYDHPMPFEPYGKRGWLDEQISWGP